MIAPPDISHWFAQLYPDGSVPERPRLAGVVECDVCIVGAGFTGLWIAYELRRADPSLNVVVLEAEVAGFGASGRNGGAAIGMLDGTRDQWAQSGGRSGAISLERAIIDGVDRVGEVVERESIDCGWAKNGALVAARTEPDLSYLSYTVQRDRDWGFGPEDYRMLDRDELRSRVSVEGALGARFSPHCASVQPAALARGLADAVERVGGQIYERSPVTRIDPGRARARDGEVRARFVIRATEAYTESIDGARRRVVPLHTSMLATEPLERSTFAKIGWAHREALLVPQPFVHLQHTHDHRITIGGDDPRMPYRFGSAARDAGPPPPNVVSYYRNQLIRLFPDLRDVRIERSWQGVLGAPRTWRPGVNLDRRTGLGWAGGYVGAGVVPSNVAGRTMRDLILGMDTALTRLPWVAPVPRRWEPEPLRYVGARAVYAMRSFGGRQEERTGKPSRLLSLSNRLAGYGGHG